MCPSSVSVVVHLTLLLSCYMSVMLGLVCSVVLEGRACVHKILVHAVSWLCQSVHRVLIGIVCTILLPDLYPLLLHQLDSMDAPFGTRVAWR